MNVSKIAGMLAKATEQQQPMLPGAAGSPILNSQGGRFARDPGEYTSPPTSRVRFTVIPGGLAGDTRQQTRQPGEDR